MVAVTDDIGDSSEPGQTVGKVPRFGMVDSLVVERVEPDFGAGVQDAVRRDQTDVGSPFWVGRVKEGEVAGSQFMARGELPATLGLVDAISGEVYPEELEDDLDEARTVDPEWGAPTPEVRCPEV